MNVEIFIPELNRYDPEICEKHHECGPFTEDGDGFYFFYLTNRKIHRYSYLISQYLSDADVWNGVVKGLPGPGYTGLWFLRKIRFFKAADSEIFIDNPVCPMANWGHEESLKKWPFVVFFSPAVKPLSTSSYHDVIATFSTQEQAVEFAQDITRAYKVSTLVGEFCYSVWWH